MFTSFHSSLRWLFISLFCNIRSYFWQIGTIATVMHGVWNLQNMVRGRESGEVAIVTVSHYVI
jgi:hypothetical protein